MSIIFIVFALFFSSLVSATSLNKIVVFGDSLSDNGNLYEYMNRELPMSPPYFKGRFTNGPVWIELLAKTYYPKQSQSHLLDYAFGGAGVSEEVDDDDDGEEVLFTLRREIDGYLLAHQDKADDSSLYVVWMGANNYLAVPEQVDEAVSAVILGIKHDLVRLVSKGAKYIMVVDLPDLGRIPAAQDFDAVALLSSLSEKHNASLSDMVAQLKREYPDVTWLYFDVNHILDDVMNFPERYGFSNVTDTCYEEMVYSPSQKSVLNMVSTARPLIHSVNKLVDACTGHLFFDPVHPTAPAHQIMAAKTKDILDAAGIQFN